MSTNNNNTINFKNEDEIDIDELEFNNNFENNQEVCFSPIISEGEENYANIEADFAANFADSSDDLEIVDGKVVHFSKQNDQPGLNYLEDNVENNLVKEEEDEIDIAGGKNGVYHTEQLEAKNEEADTPVKFEAEVKEDEEDDFMNAAQDVQYDSDVPDLPLIDAKSESDSGSDSDSDDSVGIEDLEDFDEGPKPTQPILSENESKVVLAPELPAEPLPLDTPIHPLGVVYSNKNLNTNTATIVIKSSPQFNHFALDLDSTLVLNDLTVLGTVHETFGPVQDPWYSVLVHADRAEHFPEGAEVYFVLNLSKPVEIQQLRKIKGSDASNLYDEEVGEHELEFSDDEEEQLYKKQRRENGKAKWMAKKQNEKGLPPSNGGGGNEGGQREERRLRVYDL
ncbi:NAF1-domain-containing protein [Conidiobolus coronatus NRRL 28638]|uniref:H/ACA ribonucleoprotein complex non-core subunit NAF1 n=1 Tax=Conidiobolus coronatus (strain ATCC 28846 / CBS 209.66 / NRRL 28638) TaxID=796925 RepID=A0A137NXP8_CONC2|nr:NAF1-domain-containing protein [Conidiobolus coronatus NRRL 28638]|eukprot:KXN67640.1 NAF1-domain-containing protein [Conidiobolus coronatus NRRL 28638]